MQLNKGYSDRKLMPILYAGDDKMKTIAIQTAERTEMVNITREIENTIYFCEFDGPRRRKVYVKIIKG